MSKEKLPPLSPETLARPSRRSFLKLVGTAAVAGPVFLSVGARAGEETPYERAQYYLGNARDLVARARDAEGQAQRQLATEAHTELTEARSAIADGTPEERERMARPMLRLEKEIDDLLD